MFLIDSHVLIWALDTSSSKLSPAAMNVLKNADELFVSIASLWEITTKIGEGKLRVPFEPSEFARICAARSITVLPVTPAELDALKRLPLLHADMFDRMLVATAITHDFTIVTDNPAVAQYNVPTLF